MEPRLDILEVLEVLEIADKVQISPANAQSLLQPAAAQSLNKNLSSAQKELFAALVVRELEKSNV